MKVLKNQFAQYELCFGNRFHVNPTGLNIKSTGFKIAGDPATVFLTDTPNDTKTGVVSIVKQTSIGERIVVSKDAGIVDYEKGEIILNYG